MRIQDKDVSKFKLGDIFYECHYGINIEVKVTKVPEESTQEDGRKYWTWVGINTQNQKEITYGLTEGLSYCGPRLYSEPQYAHVGENQSLYYELLGE